MNIFKEFVFTDFSCQLSNLWNLSTWHDSDWHSSTQLLSTDITFIGHSLLLQNREYRCFYFNWLPTPYQDLQPKRNGKYIKHNNNNQFTVGNSSNVMVATIATLIYPNKKSPTALINQINALFCPSFQGVTERGAFCIQIFTYFIINFNVPN